MEEALNQQSGGTEQDHRESHLCYDENPAEAGRALSIAFQRAVQIATRRLPSGEQAKEQSSDDCEGSCEGQDRPVDRDGIARREIDGVRGVQVTHGDEGGEKSKQRSTNREEQAFREQLADNAKSAGAKRGAQTEFLAAFNRPAEQQTGDVHTGNEQNESHGGKKDDQTRTKIAASEPCEIKLQTDYVRQTIRGNGVRRRCGDHPFLQRTEFILGARTANTRIQQAEYSDRGIPRMLCKIALRSDQTPHLRLLRIERA